MNFFRKAYEKAKSLFTTEVIRQVQVDGTRNTTATRRAARLLRQRYIHRSTTLTEVPDELVRIIGSKWIRTGKGHTYTSPKGVIRKHADVLAKDLKLDNKQRIELRRSMMRDLEERLEKQA